MATRFRVSLCLSTACAAALLVFGCTGDDGEAGPAGADGLDGADGADGADGPPGMAGAPGPRGEPGADGENGADGADGLPGADGADGAAGADGSDGSDGSDGFDGNDGCDAPAPAPSTMDLPGPAFFPEGIAAGPWGEVYVGSLAQSEIVRWTGQGWEQLADSTNLDSPVGMKTNADGTQLWACDTDVTSLLAGAPTKAGSIVGFDTADGSVIARHDLPGGVGSMCNDLAWDDAGNLYATDTTMNQIAIVAASDLATDNSATTWSSDAIYVANIEPGVDFGLNGIAYWDGHIYVVNFTSGELYRVPVNSDGTAAAAELMTVDVGPLMGPDGILFVNDGELLVAENFGNALSLLTIDGTDASLSVLNSRILDAPATVAVVNGVAWVTNSQVDHLLDPVNAGRPAVPFQLAAVPVHDLVGYDVAQPVEHDSWSAEDLCPVEGAFGQLERRDDGWTLRYQTYALPAGAYSNWWVVVNAPACMDPDAACSPEVAAIWADGYDVDAGGMIQRTVELPTGALTDGRQILDMPDFDPPITESELTNPHGAALMYVIKWHGEASADATTHDAQINTVDGSCDTNFPELSEWWEMPTCPDVQVLHFMP